LFLCGAFALTCSTLEEVQGEQEEIITTRTTTTTTIQGTSSNCVHHNYSVVVKKHEEACVNRCKTICSLTLKMFLITLNIK
jgi:hypothetical protein